MNKKEAFLKPIRIAEYTGLTLNFVENLIEEGELEKVEISGSVRVRMSDVDRWLDEEVKPEELVKMAENLEEDVDVAEIAETLEVDQQEVKEILNHTDR